MGSSLWAAESRRRSRVLRIRRTIDWYTFFDLARIEAGRISEELHNNASVAASLPILFRTLRGQKISEKKLEKLVELIKKA